MLNKCYLINISILLQLFEMGLELSLARLRALAKYAFGMGLPQVRCENIVLC